ncbi:mannitol operon transcriptional activator MtlR [Bacillus carboniphilus]|uniref:Mannitol operon transcriptional activator MtlR n=1 Tax=Bacillus carboniphilus TaxID=86663 RepID=A0ABN0W1D7_9BACI
MYISARERKILEHLLSKREEVTVKDIANELDVSPRTVHRDLKGVEEILKENGLTLNKKSGIGIQVAGSDENREKLTLFLFHLSHNEYTPEERQTIILSTLLDTKEPIKLVSLANDLNVTIATVSNDLNKIEEKIVPYGLHLVRKRGYGVEISGGESAKRKAMSKLIMENVDEFELISILKESIQRKASPPDDTATDRLLGLVDKKKLLVIEKQIDRIKHELPYEIADSSYIGLVVHLALAIERIQQGEEIRFEEEYLKNLKQSKEFEVARKIVDGLEEVFRIRISYGEIGYITMHLLGAKLRTDQDELLEDTSIQVGVSAQKLIRFVSNKIDVDLTKHVSLFQGLVAHLRPAIYRMKQNMGISNPLLSRIEQDYGELFLIIEEGVREVFPDIHVPSEEVGYLVMHFASALINRREENSQTVLVVCSTGIGTSKILSTKLKQEISGLKTINASLFDLNKLNLEDYDTIISTVPLKNLDQNYIVVSPLLPVDDVEKIKRSLMAPKPFQQKKKETEAANPFDTIGLLAEFEKVHHFSKAIYTVLKGFSVYNTPVEYRSIENALEYISGLLKERGIVDNEKTVLAELLKREELGGLGIPGTTLALYHARSDSVIEPSFTISRLQRPQQVPSMDGTSIEIHTILLLLAPREPGVETLEVLSGISSLIIRDESIIQLFQSGSEEELGMLLGKELRDIYKDKTNI